MRISNFGLSVSGVFISAKRFYNPVSLAVALRTCAKIFNAKPRIFHSAFSGIFGHLGPQQLPVLLELLAQ